METSKCNITPISTTPLLLRDKNKWYDVDSYLQRFAIGTDKFAIVIGCRPPSEGAKDKDIFDLRKWSDASGWLTVSSLSCMETSKLPDDKKGVEYQKSINDLRDLAKFFSTSCDVHALEPLK